MIESLCAAFYLSFRFSIHIMMYWAYYRIETYYIVNRFIICFLGSIKRYYFLFTCQLDWCHTGCQIEGHKNSCAFNIILYGPTSTCGNKEVQICYFDNRHCSIHIIIRFPVIKYTVKTMYR